MKTKPKEKQQTHLRPLPTAHNEPYVEANPQYLGAPEMSHDQPERIREVSVAVMEKWATADVTLIQLVDV